MEIVHHFSVSLGTTVIFDEAGTVKSRVYHYVDALVFLWLLCLPLMQNSLFHQEKDFLLLAGFHVTVY